MDIISSLRQLANGLNTDKGSYVTLDCNNLPPAYSKEDVLQFAREVGATFNTFTDMKENGDKFLFDFSSSADATSFASSLEKEFFQDDEQESPVSIHSKSSASDEAPPLLPTRRLY